ncbi:MAG: thioesterase family protein, partial [Bacteroidota bacterium]
MISHETQVRVRYAETDQMGVVYHGVYPQYFEVGRAELIREYGLSYAEMEASGVVMPVTELHVRYLRPALYDELLTLRTFVAKLPEQRIVMQTEVYNEAGKLCVAGKVTLAFIDQSTRKSVPPPAKFMEIL